MNIGEQIAKYRKERHLTQEQLGEALGVTNRTVSKWESGLSSPGVDLIPPLASALGITLEQLFGIEKTNENTDNMRQLKEIISSSIEESLPDIIEDALDDALSKLLPKYLYAHNNKDDHSLLVIGRYKTTVVRFYGEGRVICMSRISDPPMFAVSIPAQGGDKLLMGYTTQESAAEALQSIFKAYTAKMKMIEL
ncbi:MAG: helix-turn-helix transcriptional regulator [Clostridia bacterium]|nr:helix-turn-helix transcriptional regulator [Clostridia bacterium]